jgi:nitrogen regulatory protein P-II 1
MKRIEAIIERTRLEEFKHALDAAGIKGITVIEVKERGRRHSHAEWINGVEYHLDFLPKIKLDLILEDHQVDHAVDALSAAAKGPELSDMTLVISSIDEVIRIRSSDKDNAKTQVRVPHDKGWPSFERHHRL